MKDGPRNEWEKLNMGRRARENQKTQRNGHLFALSQFPPFPFSLYFLLMQSQAFFGQC